MDVKVLVVEDHSIVKMGLTAILNKLNVQKVGDVATCTDLMIELGTNDYTHLILDIILPDGNTLEYLETITEKYPHLSILVHSMQPVEVYGKISNKFKIHSYLHKGASESEINYHLELFIKGQPLALKKKVEDVGNPFSTLAVRELEILHYLLNGYRTKEIANSLGLKMNTVSTIKSNIFDKVKADSFTHLLQLAHVHQISY
jgi:two-component system invasion response regulator UvrY